MIKRRKTCRLCEGTNLALALQLTPTPPANAFVPAERKNELQPVFPLDVFLCQSCGHAQLLDVVDPEILFRDYVYVSGTSPVFVEHFRLYAEAVLQRLNPSERGLVVELGSNDGTLLKFFQQKGFQALGIDPAKEIARRATVGGVETLPDFFTADLAKKIRDEKGPALVMAANNVFAHIDDLSDVTRGIKTLLAPGGLFVFEVSYLADVIQNTLFDTIYHEHLCYHGVKPLVSFFARHGLQLFDVERVSPHGGSLRGYVQQAGGPRPLSPRVKNLVESEDRMGLSTLDTFKTFSENIQGLKTRLGALLTALKHEGHHVAGFGAPAKATTLLYHFDLGRALDFIMDDSPLKQHLFSPGHHLPVLPSTALYERKPSHVVVLAWNFADSIIKKHQAFRDQGGRFIVPLPQLEVR